MTKYTITPRLRELIDTSDLPSDVRDQFVQRRWISHSDIIHLYKLKKAATDKDGDDDQANSCLLDLLKGSLIYKDAEIKPPKSPEFLRQMERLRLKEQEQEYRRLVSGNPSSGVFKINAAIPGKNSVSGEDEGYDGSVKRFGANQEVKELRHQLTTILNILISVGSVAYAVWYWTGTSMRVNNAIRVLISLFFAILVLVAEVVVFGGYLKRVEEAKVTERAKVEERKVVDTVVFSKNK